MEGERIVVSASTKAVNGITVDPFNEHRLACHTNDGVVQIWDARKFGPQPVRGSRPTPNQNTTHPCCLLGMPFLYLAASF